MGKSRKAAETEAAVDEGSVQDAPLATDGASVDTSADAGVAIPGPGFKGHEVVDPRTIPILDDGLVRMYPHGPAAVVAAFRTQDGTLYEVADGFVDVRAEHLDTAHTFGFSASPPAGE